MISSLFDLILRILYFTSTKPTFFFKNQTWKYKKIFIVCKLGLLFFYILMDVAQLFF